MIVTKKVAYNLFQIMSSGRSVLPNHVEKPIRHAQVCTSRSI